MAKSDARENKSLLGAFEALGNTQSVREFIGSVQDLSLSEKELIVDQAIVLIDQLYAHLPLKRARHAVSPVRELQLVRHRLQGMSESAFQMQMIEVFKQLRDAHTNYGLPKQYSDRIAFLPFLMEDYFSDGSRRFLLTRVLFGFEDERFRRGAEITHWNGTPIERAVQLNADREEGSNAAARLAFGLSAMTVRSLGSSLPPNEEWVIVSYTIDGSEHEIVLPWRVWNFSSDPRPDLGAEDASAREGRSPQTLAASICARVARTHRARKMLFASEAMEVEARSVEARAALRTKGRQVGDVDLSGVDSSGLHLSTESLLPDVFQFSTHRSFNKDFGLIRIRTFSENVSTFINEFLRILQLMPASGLILDVRSNGGGVILNGELLLQLFTPKTITPEPFHFINSPLTQEICSQPEAGTVPPDIEDWRSDLAAQWGRSIAQSTETGAVFSRGVSLTSPVLANVLGQRYHGPVVLVTDAQCYSTTDIFAAGFQDHQIGPILGIDANTGAGGANVWEHGDHLVPLLPSVQSPIKPLPAGVSMRVAIRRSMRVGESAGQPLEDLGVRPDIEYLMTRDDLLNANVDLIAKATQVLNQMIVRKLNVEIDSITGAGITVLVNTLNIDRLDCFLDERPRLTENVQEGEHKLNIPTDGGMGVVLEIKGYEGTELVAARRVMLGG
jgi:hypothetical protein